MPRQLNEMLSLLTMERGDMVRYEPPETATELQQRNAGRTAHVVTTSVRGDVTTVVLRWTTDFSREEMTAGSCDVAWWRLVGRARREDDGTTLLEIADGELPKIEWQTCETGRFPLPYVTLERPRRTLDRRS